MGSEVSNLGGNEKRKNLIAIFITSLSYNISFEIKLKTYEANMSMSADVFRWEMLLSDAKIMFIYICKTNKYVWFYVSFTLCFLIKLDITCFRGAGKLILLLLGRATQAVSPCLQSLS